MNQPIKCKNNRLSNRVTENDLISFWGRIHFTGSCFCGMYILKCKINLKKKKPKKNKFSNLKKDILNE